MLTDKQITKTLLKRQAEYRKRGKSSEWLAAYAKGFKSVNLERAKQ